MNLKNKVSWDEVGANDLFFEMKTCKNMQEGVWMRNYNLIRVDDAVIPISTVGKKYEVMQNQELNAIVNSFDGNGFNLELNLKESCANGNRKFQLIYDIKGKNIDIGADDFDGPMRPQILFYNSYDRTSSLNVMFRINRQVCSNGLVMPVMISQLKLMHIKRNGNLKKIIHQFLMDVINNDVFDDVRHFIIKNKEKQSISKNLKYSFLKSLSRKQLILTLAAIHTHSQIRVVTHTLENIFSESAVLKLIEKIVKEKSKKKDKETYDYMTKIKEQWIDALKEVKEYNEKVTNHWLLYNLIIKVIQMIVVKHRRNELALRIAKQFV